MNHCCWSGVILPQGKISSNKNLFDPSNTSCAGRSGRALQLSIRQNFLFLKWLETTKICPHRLLVGCFVLNQCLAQLARRWCVTFAVGEELEADRCSGVLGWHCAFPALTDGPLEHPGSLSLPTPLPTCWHSQIQLKSGWVLGRAGQKDAAALLAVEQGKLCAVHSKEANKEGLLQSRSFLSRIHSG